MPSTSSWNHPFSKPNPDIKIKEELEAFASGSNVLLAMSDSIPNGLVPEMSNIVDANIVNVAREKANEVSSDVKSITLIQLYNEYVVPFELWEVYMTEVRSLALPESDGSCLQRL